MIYKANPKITGFHGTKIDNIASILSDGFRESLQHKMWFGDGVYFFIEGIGHNTPVDSAIQFKLDTGLKENEICVFEAVIKVHEDKLLDLTQTLGLQLFNEFRDKVIKKFLEIDKTPKRTLEDYDILNYMRKHLGIEFVKGNVYIRFAVLKDKEIRSNVANCTIFVVNKPLTNILKPTIKVVHKGG